MVFFQDDVDRFMELVEPILAVKSVFISYSQVFKFGHVALNTSPLLLNDPRYLAVI